MRGSVAEKLPPRATALDLLGETSSLLGSSNSSKQQRSERNDTAPCCSSDHTNAAAAALHHHGSASVSETIINEAKTCMGTGCLALPYAARVGGVLLHVTGLVAIGLWNIYAVHRLCQCLYLLPKEAVILEDDDDAAAAAAAADDGADDDGVTEPETSLLELPPSSPLFHHRSHSGEDAPGTIENGLKQRQQQPTLQDAKRIIPPPPGTSTYSRVAWYAFGPLGLFALDFMMAALFIGVVVAFVNASRDFLRDTPVTSGSEALDAFVIAMIIGPMSAVPDLGHLSRASAMGLFVLFLSFIVIAGYGFIEYFQDGKLVEPSWNWLPQDGINDVSQWFGCVVFGYGIAPLTYNFRESMMEPAKMVPASTAALLIVAGSYVIIGVGLYALFPDIDGDIIHALPATGWLPLLTRLSMTIVVFVSAPLLIVPCGQLVEGKLLQGTLAADVPNSIRAIVRIGIALACVSISVLVPGFVHVLSLVGCACVAAVGFVVPPLLYLRLQYMRSAWSWLLIGDVIMLLWGTVATGISTAYTFRTITAGHS